MFCFGKRKGIRFFIFSYGEERINCHSVTPGNLNTNQQHISSSSDDSDTSDSAKTTLNKKVRRDKIFIYWICYRKNLQKILLFTQEQRIYNQILKTTFMEFCNLECLFSLSAVGISVFTAQNPQKEHVCLSFADVPASWEVNVGHKWKILTLELASWIEDKYKLHYKKCQLKDYIHIDFEKMFMLKPFFAELRRTYNPAVYVQYRKARNHQYVNIKLQSIQIDNKQAATNDSIILCPLPVETIKTTVPFVEFCCFKNNFKNCNVYKNIQLNIGDFYFNVDAGLFQKISGLIEEYFKTNNELALLYVNDMSTIHSSITRINKVFNYINKLKKNQNHCF